MTNKPNALDPEELWDRLLSRDSDQVRTAFSTLTKDEQESILSHLRRMANDPGWHTEQRLSAQCALIALEEALI